MADEEGRTTFRATLELAGKTATGIEVPPDVVAALGSSKRPPVRVAINGHSYRSTIAVMGGRFMLPVSAAQRAGAGVAAGEEVEVELATDTEPREVAVPPDLAVALDGDAEARAAFARLSYSHRSRHVIAVEGAKTEATRQRRIAGALRMLREGRG